MFFRNFCLGTQFRNLFGGSKVRFLNRAPGRALGTLAGLPGQGWWGGIGAVLGTDKSLWAGRPVRAIVALHVPIILVIAIIKPRHGSINRNFGNARLGLKTACGDQESIHFIC